MNYNELTDDELLLELKKQKALSAKSKVMQMGLKVFLNSAYGMLGNQYSRYYDVRIAEAITVSGQLSIQWIKKKLNDFLNEKLHTEQDYILAGDTDSVYITLKEVVDQYGIEDKHRIVSMLDKFCEQFIQPVIENSYKELSEYMNSAKQKMNMSREVIASRGLWRKKKNYALDVYNSEGVAYDEPKLKIMGLEAVRASTPEVCRTAIKDSIKIILREDEVALQKFVSEFKAKFMKLDLLDIGSPRGISDIDKWNSVTDGFMSRTPIHVKGAITYNRLIIEHGLEKQYRLISNGDKIKFLYLKPENPTFSNVISFPDILPPEFNLDKYIDLVVQFEKTFKSPIDTLCELADWSSVRRRKLF